MSFDESDYYKQTSMDRKVMAQAYAVLQRGLSAGIPEHQLRIGEDKFLELLDKGYHKNPEELAHEIFSNPIDYLCKFPFVLIDGGTMPARKKAGFALLFRIIVCDNFGTYKDCRELSHKFQIFRTNNKENRNDYIADLKDQDVMFISEFSYDKVASKHFDQGTMFDELFNFREDNIKPTIISFSKPLTKDNKITDTDAGEYFADLSSNLNSSERVLRIRVNG